jgi:hypothetical protein
MGSIVECTLNIAEGGAPSKDVPQATTRRMLLADLLVEHLNRRTARVRREQASEE